MTERIYILAGLDAIITILTMLKIWQVIGSPKRRAYFERYDQTLTDVFVILCGLFWFLFWLAALIHGFRNYKGKVRL